MRLDINYKKKKKNCKKHKHMEIKQHVLNNQQVTEEIKREIKECLETSNNESMTTQNLWDAAKADLMEVYSNTILPQETRKTSNRQPNFKPTIEKEQQQQKNSRRKEIIKIRTEINGKEMK